MSQVNELEKKLKEPVRRSDLSFNITNVDKTNRKVQVKSQIKSQALMNRLDDLFGIDGWKDRYAVLYNCVTCKLSIKLGDNWITKENSAPLVNAESLNEAFTDALRQAAVRFGLGRYLLDLPNIYVDIMENKPENSKHEVHFFQSGELSGWWEEPDYPSKDASENSSVVTDVKKSDFSEFSLTEKLEYLISKQIITEKKHSGYLAKLEDKKTGPGLLRYFEMQFNLLHGLSELVKRNKISSDQRATIYKRVMSSKMNGFKAIENEIKHLEAA
ncbi:MAG: Rad52/Rad22 family DNA repair protein [Candidatus Cloacimonetes bacterium]|jgi:hypothetical protein|nr:Rad52/Rad22 family DNA repair protein [Candidatus Cloacimonadota bacterium]